MGKQSKVEVESDDDFSEEERQLKESKKRTS